MYGIQGIFWLIAILVAVIQHVISSEFPERECCDLPQLQPTVTPVNDTTTTRPGLNLKTAVAVLNCLLARQLCFEDASCSAILEIIPRVCGLELVACSTVTVTKCQAAIRTLQAFPFFKPTCLCREAYVDPDCNTFRDLLFDHPCVFVVKREKEPYPVDALPTCNHALSVCQQERKCIKLYEEFKYNCKVRDNKCRMDDRDLCYESWTNLRRSPMFGCICPNNHMKKRCDRIFGMVNHNPCMAMDNSTTALDYGLGNAIVENPLVDSRSALEMNLDNDRASVAVLTNRGKPGNYSQYPEDLVGYSTNALGHQKYPGSSEAGSSDGGGEPTTRVVFQSTCHLAMESCNSNYHCRVSLAPILLHCEISSCNRHSCKEALKSFYRKTNIPWNVDIAFCLCKKTNNKDDVCLIAQEKLHPVCAQRNEGAPQPTCLSLAENCKSSNECRSRLEYYEQSCAVDSVTKKCAGSPGDCRTAMMGILGTELRTTCACKGTDMAQLYECLGWQRLLWVNPCVVESQKDFHMKKIAEQSLHSTTTTTHKPSTKVTTTTHIISQEETTLSKSPDNNLTTIAITEAPLQRVNTTVGEYMSKWNSFIRTTTTTTTSTTTEPSTLPPKYCIVQSTQFPEHLIREGTFKRIYHRDEFECSDVCECEIGEKLTCKTICIDRLPCKTEFAYYTHDAPAYQAFRGRCLCYSGSFICMKPIPNGYNLPQGVYLFLGYSEVDERELNKNQTRIVVQDVVRVLQTLIEEQAVNETLCSLEIFNTTKENVIIAGRLSDEIDRTIFSPAESLSKEKEVCSGFLEAISQKVNTRSPEFTSHLLLSIFKMAEVEIVQAKPSSTCHIAAMSLHLVIITTLAIKFTPVILWRSF